MVMAKAKVTATPWEFSRSVFASASGMMWSPAFR